MTIAPLFPTPVAKTPSQSLTPIVPPFYFSQNLTSSRNISIGILASNAFNNLQAYRLRSLLAMLGMIIGVAAVITVVSLTQSASEEINFYLMHLGTNVITIIPNPISTGGALGTTHALTQADAQAIATQTPHITTTSPVMNSSAQVIYGDQIWNSPIQGVTPDFQDLAQWQISEGSWFSDQDEQLHASVAVLGQTVASRLFGEGASAVDPIGQTIRLRNQFFRVSGVLLPKGAQGNADADNVIFLPFSTFSTRLKPSNSVDQIQIETDDMNTIMQTQIAIISLLRTRHHLRGVDPVIQNLQQQQSAFAHSSSFLQGTTTLSGTSMPSNGDLDDFQVLSNTLLIQTVQQDTHILDMLLIGIAAISLSVGGIGIMNIMLASVTERTREIGICMAVGARQSDICKQFLLEALILCTLGGLLGILSGSLGGFLLTRCFHLPFLLSSLSIIIALTVSAIIGIGFGLYPAIRASKLDPVVALHTLS